MRKVAEVDLLLWLCTTANVGGVTIRKLHDFFDGWQNVWAASDAELLGAAASLGIMRRRVQELCASRRAFDPVRVRAGFEGEGIRFVACVEAEYPAVLHELYDPPGGLFVAGTLPATGSSALAVVGSRKVTPYGRQVTERLVSACAGQGELTIVSGLARGIDTIAHRATVQAGGQTVAVLGSGLLSVYPKENEPLAKQIADGHGAVISEFHPLMPGKPGHFPVRNRIIAALAQGVLVVEAGEKSGSLITADQALEQGRDVYAVPGPITSPQSVGTNRLIQQGAKPVLGEGDLLEDYHVTSPAVPVLTPKQQAFAPEAMQLLDCIGYTEAHIDDLLSRTGWDAGLLHTWLLRLQLQGVLIAMPGGRVMRAGHHA